MMLEVRGKIQSCKNFHRSYIDTDTMILRPAPDADRLFERFYRSSSAREKGGAGLGLSVVRELRERMQGSVCARIEDGTPKICLLFDRKDR